MLALLGLFAALMAPAATAPDGSDGMEETVLVRVDEMPAGGREAVVGWARVAASEVGPGVESVPDAHLDLLGWPGDEPRFGEQWPLALIGMEAAWPMAVGDPSTLIAVVDSGIDFTHPELAGRIFVNPGEVPGNGVDDDGNGYGDDVSGWDFVDDDGDPTDPSVGHGTEVAAVAMAGADGVGMAGVAPGATVLPIRACSTQCLLFDVAAGIVYAVESGADIIVLSLGGFAQPGPVADAMDLAEEAGILVVAAAGNLGTDIDDGSFVPGSLPNPNLITVAATDRDDRLWADSNFGAEAVDLGAPGVELLTATLVSGGSYTTVTGTSYSAPHVAGVAALMMEVRPGITPAEIISLIGRHGIPLPDLAATTVSGTRLAADRAVGAARWTDIDDSIFDHDIVWMGLAGLTNGCNPPTDTHYCPDRPVTRAETAAFLARALDLPPGPDAFTDDDANLHHDAINALAQAEITTGCGPAEFCPDHPVTRAEMAAFLARALDLPPGSDAFSDDDANLHHDAINALAQAEITTGCGPAEFCPDHPVTRAEMAAFLARALDLPPGPDAFTDDDANLHHDAINALAQAEITTGCGPAEFCPDHPVTRAELAALLHRSFG